MILSQGLQAALPLVVISIPVFLLGYITRTRGPQGIVHGMVDWSRLSDEDRQAAGRFVGLVLYLVGLALLGSAALTDFESANAAFASWTGLGVAVVMSALVVTLILGLLPCRKRYRDPLKGPDDR